jgi:DNA-binding NtrC family response regulator
MSIGPTVPHLVRTLPVQSLAVQVVEGPDAGKTFRSDDDRLTIGTAPGNQLTLTDETVSRYHLEIRRTGSRIEVEDHGSTNGTLHAGVQLHRATISPGTVLMLGRSAVRIDDGDPREVELYEDEKLGPLRGRSAGIRRLMARIRRAAASNVSILLIGETGTGKELFARAAHEASPRAGGPFETVDCAALLPTLMASELFGHERGAFTGADHQHLGAFERADGGTLFLDEIGELPLSLQAALLGVLERRSFRRVGGNETVSVNVRLVCATNRDLRAEVNAGRFREDLYYRIAVLTLDLPPLRDRTEDIPVLIEHFLREQGYDGPVETILSENAVTTLKKQRWPGNVRELRNFVETALVLGEVGALGSNTTQDAEAVPVPESGAPPAPTSNPFHALSMEDLSTRPYREARESVLEVFENGYLTRLLESSEGNVSKAARISKLDRSYLLQLLGRRGLR